MKLTHIEVALINYSLSLDKEQKPRRFAFSELGLVSGISKKIVALVKEDKILPGEYELEFSTEEKSKILSAIKELDWSAGDGAAVLEVVEKLS